jgi:preprotein translocase SecE subunit
LTVARTRTRPVENSSGAEPKSALLPRRRRDDEDFEDEDNGALTARKDRPTPSAREIKPRGAGSTGIISRIPVVRTIAGYFWGVSMEMSKVTWPSREETTRLTEVVLAVTVAFAIGLGLLNTFFSWWFQKAFHTNTTDIFLLVGGGVVVVVVGTYFTIRDHI